MSASTVSTPTGAATDAVVRAQSRRLAALDVLRGIAILGTLATNIGIFLAMTQTPENVSAVDHVVGTAIGLVTDGKFIGLLTIMFGIGLEIQRQSAVRKGESWLGTYPWRALLLVLDGLLNYFFIFEFDVLMGYGLTGLVVAFVLCGSPKFQTWIMGLGIAAHVALLTYMSWPMLTSSDDYAVLDSLPDDPASLTPEQITQMAQEAGVSTAEVRRMMAEYTDPSVATGGPDVIPSADAMISSTDSYWAGVVERATNFVSGRGEIPIMFVMGMGLFLVGGWLYRAGLFEERGAKLRRWVMGLSFGIGLPLDWVTRLWFAEYTSMYNRYLTSAMVSFGLLALVAAFYARGRTPGFVGKAVSNVGKMALTCYIGQNLIASILFYDWGFGLARHMRWGVWDTVIGWAVISAILLIFSAVWLRFFRRGPIEWLWHVSHAAIIKRTLPVTDRWGEKRKAWAARRAEEKTPSPVG
ncbi:MAG: DUF418 domain-containing protein [Mobilicoccus sp.]|nr:DUF418 domain-containing protein [Mobilicoccus sp.]